MAEAGWKPVIVGVDQSPESAGAAAMGWKIASAAGTECYLVHGTHEVSAISVSPPPLPFDPDKLTKQLTEAVYRKLKEALRGHVPPEALKHVEVRLGNGAWALHHSVEEHDAGLVVLGGKHHAPPARWLGGSTAHHAVRMIDVPLLITWSPRQAIRRILAAVDLSYAAEPTLKVAVRFARLLGAELRVLHVLEALPFADELPLPFNEESYHEQSARHFESLLKRVLGDTEIDHMVQRGEPPRVIGEESASFDADLVVVGSHGKGWVDRLLIGSTTERLINHLPTSLVVVPVRAAEDDWTVFRLTGGVAKKASVR
jgi:nucleotide-binding universal stress UspA family protein